MLQAASLTTTCLPCSLLQPFGSHPPILPLQVDASRYLFWSQHVRVWIAKESQCWHSTILGARPTTDLQRSKSYGWPPPSLCSMHPQPLDAQNYFGLRHKQAVKSLWEKKDAECLKRKTKHKAYFLSELCIANEEKRLWHFGSLAEAHVAKQFVWRGHTPAHTWVAHSHNSTQISKIQP